MSKLWKFDGLLQAEGWLMPAYVTTNSKGVITAISSNEPKLSEEVEVVHGFALPGFQNAHSHSFQYAMSGLAEIHSDPAADDDFWSWRETMYNIALSMDPEQFEHIATMLYAEMLSHGYSHVAEFHYVHHNQQGQPYDNIAEMSERLVSAAQTAGIGITLVPIFYQRGGFGQDPGVKQRRFISKSSDDYAELLQASQKATKNYSKANIGLGIHSLRAVEKEAIQMTLQDSRQLPVHIHISEQLKEVEDCLKFYGQRPVEWLIDHFEVNKNFHLVHATHLNEHEVSQIANSDAYVVICPSTEGNLGDGLFPLTSFQKQGGQWSIGTDSHIGLNPLEELRILDYGQRLTTHKRNQFISKNNGDSGFFGFDMALRSGRKAMGNNEEEYFAVGQPFDSTVVDAQSPLIISCKPKHLLSTMVYSGDRSWSKGTITDGRWKVRDGKHVGLDNILSNFKQSMEQLKIR